MCKYCFFEQMVTVLMYNLQGMPTHDAGGNELSKSALKKLAKQYELQEKRYDEYLKTLNMHQQDH